MLPRRSVSRILLAGFAVTTLLHLGAQLGALPVLENVTQWLLMPLLAVMLYVETTAPRGRLVSLTLVALTLSWLGDTAPDLASGDTSFLLMVGFFLLAQLAYIIAFLPYRAHSVLTRRRWLLAVYVAAVVGLVAACAGGAEQMLVPVLAYGACLGAMAVLSTGVHPATALGGALFLVSDGLIALGAFAPGFDPPFEGFWVMVTYVAAQVFIVGGVLAEQRQSRPMLRDLCL